MILIKAFNLPYAAIISSILFFKTCRELSVSHCRSIGFHRAPQDSKVKLDRPHIWELNGTWVDYCHYWLMIMSPSFSQRQCDSRKDNIQCLQVFDDVFATDKLQWIGIYSPMNKVHMTWNSKHFTKFMTRSLSCAKIFHVDILFSTNFVIADFLKIWFHAFHAIKLSFQSIFYNLIF